MHRLVQPATKEWLDGHGEIVKWDKEASTTIAEAFLPGSHENWTKCEPLLSHVETVLSYNLDDLNDLLNQASILHNLAWYHWLKGDYQLSKLEIDRAVKIRSIYLSYKNPTLLASTGLCATVISNQGKYEEAEAMHRQMLQLKERVLGVEHPSTLASPKKPGLGAQQPGQVRGGRGDASTGAAAEGEGAGRRAP
jgi:tetratricopeptide (TPR) repeat protein